MGLLPLYGADSPTPTVGARIGGKTGPGREMGATFTVTLPIARRCRDRQGGLTRADVRTACP